mgnify:CR=1 FL=1
MWNKISITSGCWHEDMKIYSQCFVNIFLFLLFFLPINLLQKKQQQQQMVINDDHHHWYIHHPLFPFYFVNKSGFCHFVILFCSFYRYIDFLSSYKKWPDPIFFSIHFHWKKCCFLFHSVMILPDNKKNEKWKMIYKWNVCLFVSSIVYLFIHFFSSSFLFKSIMSMFCRCSLK